MKTDDIDGVIERIKKAMRLAQRAGTDGERAAAENAARRLADANGIALESIDADRETARNVMSEDEGERYYSGCELGYAVHILHKHFAVQVIFVLNRRHRGHVAWFGNKLNIEVAHYAWDIIISACRLHWKHYKAESVGWDGERIKRHKESFMRGWFYVIDQKLAEHPLRNDTEQFEAERKACDDTYMRWRKNNLVRDTGRKSKGNDCEAVMAGVNAAKSVNLSRPCKGEWHRADQIGQTLQLEVAV